MRIPSARDKLLFTPGPLTTSPLVRQAMLRDLGSRDHEFVQIVRDVRRELLEIAHVSQAAGYEAILIPGSGTYAVESVISSVVPPGSTLLVLVNGAYGERIVAMAGAHQIATRVLRCAENEVPQVQDIDEILRGDPDIHTVAMVHCETSTGILNPLEAIGRVVAGHGRSLVVDSMSAFGAVPMEVGQVPIDYLVSSANKCLEGVPGLAFVLARRDALLAADGWSRTLSLDLVAQWRGLEGNGQFRFTPPTHVILAFAQALRELADEGGVPSRAARYRENHAVLGQGMARLGFETHVSPPLQSHVITTFHLPSHPRFHFDRFYALLGDRGYVIYPGKLTDAPCFRIGTIGRIFPADVRGLLSAIAAVLEEMGVDLPSVPDHSVTPVRVLTVN